MTDPETEILRWAASRVRDQYGEAGDHVADRIERAMAASAVPVAPSFDREHAADIVSQLVNSHTSAWIAGEKVSAAVAAHSRQYCKQAMVEAANLLEPLISAPPAVPIESLGRDAGQDEVSEYVEDYEYFCETEDGQEGFYAPNDHERMLIEDAIRGWEDRMTGIAPPPASVPDGSKPACTWPDCRNICAWPVGGKPSCFTTPESRT